VTTPWLQWGQKQASALFQGIDYLELTLIPPSSATLVVHLQQSWIVGPPDAEPPAFSRKSFTLSGGLRITELVFDYVSEDKTAQTVTLHIQGIGDASEYTLTLVDGGELPVHPFFGSATFVFTIDCERGDCRPLAEQPKKLQRPRPAIDLLTKDYSGFVQLLGDWVRVRNASWADLSPASLERLLVELLAHHGDMLSYYQDRVGNEAFIDTASQRSSLRSHATLLGTRLFDGSAADTLLAFTSAADGYLPAEVEVTTPFGAGGTDVVFWLTERTRLLVAHNDLELAAWPGADDAVVPAGSSEVLLWGTIENLTPGQKLAFVQGDFEAGMALAEPIPPAQVVTITSARRDKLPGWTKLPTDPEHGSLREVTVVTFNPPLTTQVRPAWGKPGALRVYGNLGRAEFGRSKSDLFPLSESSFAGDRQSYSLERRPGFSRSLLRALRLREAPVVFQASVTAAGLTVTSVRLEVKVGSDRWKRVEHLIGSQSYDRHFVATADEDGSLWLEFGDGKQGRSMDVWSVAEVADAVSNGDPLPDKIQVKYRVGDPVAGNVGAGMLTRFVPNQAALGELGDLQVVNVLPGMGGKRAETKEAARLRIPASLRHGPVERAVTLADYGRAAMTVEGVGRAAAKLLGGPFNAVLVLVDPVGQVGLTAALEQAVYDRVDALRMSGREHFVSGAEYVPIDVKLAICVEPGALPHRVRDAVLAALRPGTDDNPGFFHPDRLSFSDPLELGEVLAFVQRIPGVRSVKALRFRKLKVPSKVDVEPRIELAPTEVVRLDGDDDQPDNGKLKVLIVGIDSGVTEKDFVIEEVAP
jgi:hypothetical protein